MFKKLVVVLFLLLAHFSLARATADSLNLRTVSCWPYSVNYANTTATINGHDYALAGMGGGIFIFNVDSLDAPYKVSEAAICGWNIKDIAVTGNFAYLSAYSDGLWIVDISDPLNPFVTGNVELPGLALKVSITNNYAYVAAYSSGVQIVNIADPYNPYVVGPFGGSGNYYGLDINDTLLYTASTSTGLNIYNITLPMLPVEIGHNDSIGSLNCVYYKNGLLCAGNDNDMIIYDVTDPTNPLITGIGGYGARRMAFVDTLVYAANNSFSIGINNIKNSTSIVAIKSFNADFLVSDVNVNKEHLLLSVQMYFATYNLTDPLNPTVAYKIPTPTIFDPGVVKDSFAYMPSDCMHIIKLTDSMFMHEVGSINSRFGGITGVSIKDSLLYLSDWAYGLQIANIADPYNPVVLDSIHLDGYAINIAIKDSFALLAYDVDGIKIINISNPTNVYLVDSISTSGACRQIKFRNNLAFVAEGSAGLRIYDVSNLPSLAEIGFYDTPGSALGLDVAGNYAYIADGDSGLCIIDISDSTNPVKTSSYWIPGAGSLLGGVKSVAVDDSLVYISYDTLGVRVINVSDPANPTESGYYRKIPSSQWDVATSATGLTLEANKVYVSYYSYGLQVFEYTTPGGVSAEPTASEAPKTFLLNNVYPNPVRDRVNFSYQLPAKSAVKLNIYNIAGQLVKTFDMGMQQPGKYSIPWKTGALSSGVYFYKLSAGDNRDIKKLVVLK